jgi:hypothetical protein
VPALLAALLLAAAPVTVLDHDLEQGPAPAVPYLQGTTVVDGSARLPVPAEDVQLVGPSGWWYVVVTDGERIRGLTPGGRSKELGTTDADPALSVDGSQLASTLTGRGHTAVTLRSVPTTAVLGELSLRGSLTALDVDAGRVLVSGPRRTLVWNATSGHTRVLSRRPAHAADFGHDLVALEGSCTLLLRISSGAVHWRSCTDSALSFGADASRWVTVPSRQDGPAGRVTLRDRDGRELARWRLADGLRLDELRWEDAETVLLRASGPGGTTWFRCVGADCERAGAVQPF